ncbi:MAG: hydrogenase maturation protein HypF, partial [Rhodothermales bacterium]
MTAREIRLQGLVQGVGFRPHVCRAARHLALAGTVQNDGQGLRIAIQGAPDAIQTFIDELRQSPPQHARIDAFSEHPLLPNGACEFRIIPSDDSTVQLDMPPDLATCDACLCELRNPENRRFRHPFISCTQCGPRHS